MRGKQHMGGRARKHMQSHEVLKEKSSNVMWSCGRIQGVNEKYSKEAMLQGRDKHKKSKESHQIRSKQMRVTIKAANGKQFAGCKPGISSE